MAEIEIQNQSEEKDESESGGLISESEKASSVSELNSPLPFLKGKLSQSTVAATNSRRFSKFGAANNSKGFNKTFMKFEALEQQPSIFE